VIDSAYAEYVEKDDYDSGISLVKKYENIVMTRTFSKLYGLASLRLGWSYSSKYIAEIINKVRQPFNVNSYAQLAGIEALNDVEHEKLIVKINSENLPKLINGLELFGLKVLPSVANFVLVKLRDSDYTNSLYKYLINKNILVRQVTAYNLPEHLRITVGNASEVDILLKTMEGFVKNNNGK
jgi:Histidinol-phosphate/aromatic aminotransferase and cobyric acid decarboxylase